jgi:hypothetical protein
MILFLDFDGVLHPARAVMGQHGPELAGDGSLFMWVEPLTELLAERPACADRLEHELDATFAL